MSGPDLIPSNLLLCLRPGAGSETLAGFDEQTWAEVISEARFYNLLPLLNRRLIRENPGLVLPPGVIKEIRQAYYDTLAENTRRYDTLSQALAALRGAGIPVLLLKGAYLAETIYGNIGLRPMADVDLLVPLSNLPQALGALIQAGFETEREYSDAVDGALHFHAPPMTKNGTMLEMHWSVTNPDSPLRPDIAGLWQHAVPVALHSGQSLTLAPLDLLLHLCVHASYNHAFDSQLRSLVDIREVLAVQGSGINWQTFLDTVDHWNARKGVYLALRLSVDLLGAEVPPAILAALEPPGFDQRALEWARVQLFRQAPVLGLNFNRMMHKGTPGERLRALWTGMFPPPGLLSMRYGVPLHSWRLVYLYLQRPFNRLALYWRFAFDLLKRDPQRVQEADSSLNLSDWLNNAG